MSVHFPLVDIRKEINGDWNLEEIIQIITVPSSAPYIIRLKEIPDNGEIESRPIILGLSENSSIYTPSLNEFAVKYSTGDVIFNSGQAGNSFSITYFGKGSLIEADDINYLYYRTNELSANVSDLYYITDQLSASIDDINIDNGTEIGQMTFWNGNEWTPTETSEVFWDDINKRLGIGTDSPLSKLQVKGSGITSLESALNVTDSTDTSLLFVRNDGNVGIGTDSPVYPLVLQSGETFPFWINNAAGQRRLLFSNGGDHGALTISSASQGDAWYIATNANSYFNSDFNFGIGTDSPDELFHISKSASNDQVVALIENTSSGVGNTTASMLVKNDAGNYGQLFKAGTGYTTYKTISSNDLGFYNSNVAGDISTLNDYFLGNILFTAGGDTSPHLFIKYDGNVGIGTDSPAGQMHIKGEYANLILESTVGADNFFKFTNGANSVFGVGSGSFNIGTLTDTADTGLNNKIFSLDSANGNTYLGGIDVINNPKVFINGSTGYVGIGTTTPNSDLQVNGSLSLPYKEIWDTYTITEDDFSINCISNTFIVTLPSAIGITGRIYNIKNTGDGIITVLCNGAETIDNTTSINLIKDETITIQSTGNNFIII